MQNLFVAFGYDPYRVRTLNDLALRSLTGEGGLFIL